VFIRTGMLRNILIFVLLWTTACLAAQQRNNELLTYAVAQVNEGQFVVAEQALNKLLTLEPTHKDALFLRGYCRYKTGKYESAMADMNRLISLDESVANAYLIRARLHRIRGNYWSSLSDYNRARKLDPYQTFFSITRGLVSETQE